MGSTLGSATANKSTGGGSEDSGGRGLTPLSTAVPLLVVLVAAGCSYIAVKGGLVPPKWLSSTGDGSGFRGARSEGQHDFGDKEDGEFRFSSGIALTTHDARVEEQERQLSQGSRRLSRVRAGIVDAEAEAEAAIAMGSKANEDGHCRADGEGSRDRAEARQREPLWLRRLGYPEPPKSQS